MTTTNTYTLTPITTPFFLALMALIALDVTLTECPVASGSFTATKPGYADVRIIARLGRLDCGAPATDFGYAYRGLIKGAPLADMDAVAAHFA